MGVDQGGGSTSSTDKLNLVVDDVGFFVIGISKELGVCHRSSIHRLIDYIQRMFKRSVMKPREGI